MTLRLSRSEDETLARLARSFGTSKNLAAAVAIDLAASRPDHPDFVREAVRRLLDRDSAVITRLAEV